MRRELRDFIEFVQVNMNITDLKTECVIGFVRKKKKKVQHELVTGRWSMSYEEVDLY